MYHFFSLFIPRIRERETLKDGRKKIWSYTHPMKCKVLQFVTVKCDYDDFITRCFFYIYVSGWEERERIHIMRNITLWRSHSVVRFRYSVLHSNRKRKRIKKVHIKFWAFNVHALNNVCAHTHTHTFTNVIDLKLISLLFMRKASTDGKT